MYNDPTIVIIIILAVLAGGLVKGTIGFGMPMVALPIIAFAVPVTTAMILLCAPIFLTNYLQIKFKQGVSSYRFLPMFLSLVLGLIIGARLILEINLNTITQIISILIINSSIRLSIYSKRIIIKTMQLVGATKNFIRKPFIKTHVILGVISSLISIGFLAFTIYYAESSIKDLNLMADFKIIIGLFFCILLFSVIITSICTFIATQRFLKSKIEQLY